MMSKPITVLLVEDNADDEHLMLRTLRKSVPPVEVQVARDGQQALDILLESDAPLPTIVLLDLKLPKVSGLTVLATLKGNIRASRVPVVVLVSPDAPDDIRTSYECYANGAMEKPVSLDEFTKILKRLGIGSND
jgi:two-component system response regulator